MKVARQMQRIPTSEQKRCHKLDEGTDLSGSFEGISLAGACLPAPPSLGEDPLHSFLTGRNVSSQENLVVLHYTNVAILTPCRLDAPFGTEDKPVAVTSYFSERIVGVPDPYDDSIIWWGHIKEGEPPKQIVDGGEFFVLERLHDDNIGHH